MRAWKTFESDPLFRHSNETLSLDEQRRLALLRMYKIVETKVFPFEEIMSSPKLVNIAKKYIIFCLYIIKLQLNIIVFLKNSSNVSILSVCCNKSRIDL
jgi:hypothetical protein